MDCRVRVGQWGWGSEPCLLYREILALSSSLILDDACVLPPRLQLPGMVFGFSVHIVSLRWEITQEKL